MKNRRDVLKGVKATEREKTFEDISGKPVTPQTKVSVTKQRSGSATAKRVLPKSAIQSIREVQSAEVSPHLYKAVHNIGRRKAAEHVVSYKETEIAVCFKDSYWPNAKLDLSNSVRSEPARGKSATETLKLSENKKENQVRKENAKHEKSTRDKTEARTENSGLSCDPSASQFPSNVKSKLETQKATKRKSSPSPKQSSRLRDESTRTPGDEKVKLPMAPSASRNKDDDANMSTKGPVRLSSKKRAELSFLAHGVSSNSGSDILTQRATTGDEERHVRVRRTASLNAGAIVSLMLQKEDSVAKQIKFRWDEYDDDEDDDDDDDDSTSSSSESGESTFSEYSVSGESKQMKKSTRSDTGEMVMTSSVEKAVSPTESSDEKLNVGKSSASAESSVVPRKTSVSKALTKSLEESSHFAFEDSGSPLRNTGPQSNSALDSKDSNALEIRQEACKGKKKPVLASVSVKSPLTNLQVTDDESRDTRGKRKQRELQDPQPVIVSGKRMASLNAQAILAASRDERTRRSRSSEPQNTELTTKSRSSPTEKRQLATETVVQSKSPRKTSSGECSKTSNFCGKVPVAVDSNQTKKSFVTASVSDNHAIDSAALSRSIAQRTSLDWIPFAGTYVELVSPPSSIQLVEMTSTPVLTPNKTYQQLDRPQNNCQQQTSDHHAATIWPGNPYAISQRSELHSTNGHPIDFHKNSSDHLPEKPTTNVVTGLVPHATSLAPTVPIRFTAHVVPQNPLPQQGFYGQMQSHTPYYPERFPYNRPNLFPYPTKAFSAGGCFASPHIPTDLYNASRQLQVYEVQTARPVYGRQSDFNLQLCQSQFIGPLTSHTEGQGQVQQLYRPYLSAPPHQPFQNHTPCGPPYGPSQVQVTSAVSEVNPLASEKSPVVINERCEAVHPSGKQLKTHSSDGQPKLTDISYSVVKRTNLPSRRKQVETKHSSTQVKSHQVISASGVCSVDCGLGQQEKLLPEKIKSVDEKFSSECRRTEKEEPLVYDLNKASFGDYQTKLAPPAHCQSFASGNKPTTADEELCRSDLRSYSATKHKLCDASQHRVSEGESVAKQEDLKSAVLVTGIKPVTDAGEPVTDMKPVTSDNEPVIPYSNTKLESYQLQCEALPLQDLPSESVESLCSWSKDSSQTSRQRKTSEMQSSIVDLSVNKELDLSRKTKAVMLPEALLDTIPRKKKKSTPAVTASTFESVSQRNTCFSPESTLELMSGGPSVSDNGRIEDPARISSKSCLSQLQKFVATHSSETSSDNSEVLSEQNNKFDAQVAEFKVLPIGSTFDACICKSNDPDSYSVLSCKEEESTNVITIRDDEEEDVVIVEQASSVANSPSDGGIHVKDSGVDLKADCVIVDVHIQNESHTKLNEEIISPNCKTPVQEMKASAGELELTQKEGVPEPVDAVAAVLDLTKSTAPFDVTSLECSIKAKIADLSQNTDPDIEKTKSEAKELLSGLSNKNSHENYRRSFRGVVPKKRIECLTKFSRQINLVGFADRNCSDKRKRKNRGIVNRSQRNSASVSGAVGKFEKKTGTFLSKFVPQKGKKDMTLSFTGEMKKQTRLDSILQPSSDSEKDVGVRGGGVNEEKHDGKDDGMVCWKWKEPGMMKRICTEADGQAVHQMYYSAIEHTNGDVIRVRDCVFVRSGMRKKDIPYIAKIYAFWPLQETGEMMMGVFWYYRHHQSDSEHLSKYLNNEVFASRHRDVIPVTCIEERCYVLTLNEFCRYKAERKRIECNQPKRQSVVPVAIEPFSRLPFQPLPDADPETVFLCRNIYDIKLRRISKHPRKLPH